jgi:hypothetical protein
MTNLSDNENSPIAAQPTERFFVFGDIHGEYGKFCKVLALITEKAGFDLKNDTIISLGDKNDRGPQTFEVIEWFRLAEKEYGHHVECIMGNHELMMIDAANLGRYTQDFYVPENGGPRTLRSYQDKTKLYGKKNFRLMLAQMGHFGFLRSHKLFLETDSYFFCHAPIPREYHRRIPPGFDFRCDVGTLTWSFNGEVPMERWIDSKLIPKEKDGNFYGDHKLCVYGHLHGMREFQTTGPYGRKDYNYVVPGVRKYGNAVLLDTGCGCADEGYLTCLELPSGNLYNSNGAVFNLSEVPDATQGIDPASDDAWLRD